ncbi:uncharacterized protein LOC126836950 [Adelges cooleyi]|uniref:uncharacterized protein LOC126836950 n=1 Tax=Adelges cooleyi TaxID=133065 RepID=UPI002180479D|nr:uncharacterized protein LOC126836950 [Adelges cooleyi]
MNWLSIFSGFLASGSSTIIWTLIIILLTSGLYIMYQDKRAIERRKQISLLPSITKTHWEVLKHTWHAAGLSPKAMIPYFTSVLKTVGPLVHFSAIIRDYIIICDPDDIKILLSSTQHITKGPDYRMLEPWLNKGLLTSTDEKWQTRRKLLTNTFHFKILETYIPAFNKHANGLVQNLARASKNDQLVTNLDSHVTLCALDIVCEHGFFSRLGSCRESYKPFLIDVIETILGVSLRSQEGQSIDYVKAITTVGHILMKRIFTIWLWSDTIFNVSTSGRDFYKSLKVLHTFSKNVIQERKQKLIYSENLIPESKERKKVYSFLDLLIGISKEHPNLMTDADVQEEVDTFLFEGHDTSSIAMTMALIHIGMNQNIQDDIREELQGIFGDSDRDATMEDLKSMSILERVIRETMRLYPSVPGVTRKLNQPLRLKNHIIPAECIIAIPFCILHLDESIYPNPEVFNPDRFLPEQCNDRHPYGYLPFSAGPRNCIGQKFAMYQMKTVISTVVRYKHLETIGTQKDIVVLPLLVLKADALPSLKITPLFENQRSNHLFHTIVNSSLIHSFLAMNWLSIFSGALASVSNISIIIWLLLIILLTCRLYKIYYNERAIERRKQISLLPSSTKTYLETINFIWQLASMSPQDIIPYFTSVLKSVGPLVYFNTIIRDYVFISDPDDIKILLSSTQHITKGPEYRVLEPWLNKGLLTSTNEKWQTRRKLLTNTFHFKILETYIPAFNKHAKGLVQNLANASKNDLIVSNLDSHVTLCALDIVCETILGVSLRSQEGQSIDYVNAIKTVSHILMKRMFTIWLLNNTIFKISTLGRKFFKSLKVLHAFSKYVIQQRKQKLNFSENPITGTKGDSKKVQSFLDLLIGISKEHPNSMTDADIQEEVDTFLFEGHDTSSIAMTMALIHIGMNQKIQEDIRKELQGIFGDSDRDATMEDLKSMSILERVIRETMRLYPSVPGVTRTLNQPLQLKNHTIPAHSIIGFSMYILHRDESMYPNPEVFDADRFLPEQCNDRHPYGYLPFSAGPRNCIGQKFAMYLMKTVLSTVVRHMKLETLGTQKDIVVSTQLVLKADSLPSLKLTPLFENHKKEVPGSL